MPFLGNLGKIFRHRGEIEFDWKVRKFSSLSEKSGSYYESSPFEFGGRSWYLQLFPNGETRPESKGYVALYLMPHSRGPPVEVLFSLGVKTAKEEVEECTDLKYTFKWNDKGWGESEWILRSELLRRKDELLPLDVLTIAVTCKVGLPRGGTKDVSIQTEVEDTTADVEKVGPSENTGTKNVSVQAAAQSHSTDVSVQAAAESHSTDVSVQTLFEYNGPEVSIQTAIEDKVADDVKDESVEKTGREKVLQDVQILWASGDNSDVIIRVRDVEFKAHKTILAARTPVLGAMFLHDTTEKSSGEVTIDDCDPEVFEQILHYIYTGAPRVLTAENASALYVVADKYIVNEVKALCVLCMQDTLCLDTFCNTVTLSLTYREQELLEVTIDFLSKNVIDVMKTVEWQVFLREHSTWANEILIRALEIEARNERKERANVDPSNA